MISKKQPDVLRVVQFILDKSTKNEAFSVQSATKSIELNGLTRHQLARIMRDICLAPEDDGSLERYTTVNNDDFDNHSCHWQLNANAYFNYLSYKSVEIAKRALWISILALTLTTLGLVVSGIDVLN
ncbi:MULTISPECIES: hypothetical protein [Gammaproteobacteria]|uniref:hypothetical protein n=1 Tax=Gammaproteobacteria TaxID=1236 RepID=UPI000DCF8E16|nr:MULTISPECIES: hypothetical protein [Gammaproteobacteria]RTE85511.1 hypothetical protein DQX04_11450 [Aliidiomarina sp. B3213]TCZ89481.1 hypothetical protein EYQ95_11380 [Lysobacter sp. N42]